MLKISISLRKLQWHHFSKSLGSVIVRNLSLGLSNVLFCSSSSVLRFTGKKLKSQILEETLHTPPAPLNDALAKLSRCGHSQL